MMKKPNFIRIIFLFIMMALVYGCQKNEDSGVSLNLAQSLNIKKFKIGNAVGNIDTTDAKITIDLPFGTNFTSVKPDITLPEGAIVTPASGEGIDLSSPVLYQVINGNRYKNFSVTAKEIPVILEFNVADTTGKIDEQNRTIKIVVPSGNDITQLPVDIKLAVGAHISPESGSVLDFSNPLVFTVTTTTATVKYTVTVVEENTLKPIGFLGTAATKDAVSNPDEKAAMTWLFDNYSKAEYISFNDIKNGTANLDKYSVIWWHEDATQDLPAIANDPDVVDKIITYHQNAGRLLLTTYAARWVDILGIVPPGKGPNNAFGDNVPKQDNSNDWAITFEGHEDHPLFQGLTLEAGKTSSASLISKGAFRLNHTSWWKVNEWGGYGDAAGWRAQTGGIDLAGPGDRNSNISIAEFPKTDGSGNTVVITPGAYDWYAEPDPNTSTPSPANTFLPNIERLTRNAIEYLQK